MALHVRDCNSIEIDVLFQLFEFKTPLIPRIRNWDCSKEPWGMDSYLSMTPLFFSMDLWSYQLGNQCLPGQLHFYAFFRTLYLDSIETKFLTPIDKHLFDGTSGSAFYRARSSMLPAFDRLMVLNSIELTRCFWTLFPYHSQFYRVKKLQFFEGSWSQHFSTIKSLPPGHPLTTNPYAKY